MTKKVFFHLLEQIALTNPGLSEEIGRLAFLVKKTEGESVDERILQRFLKSCPALADCFRNHLEMGEEKEELKPSGKIFPVHKPLSNEIRKRVKLAEQEEHYRNWANAVKAVPEYTLPLPKVDGDFIRMAKEVWHQHIYGNEEILQAILRHSIEYSRTGRTMPLLLVGDPGVGKTLVAKNYGRILNLPCSFISGPSASAGRGLSGAPNLYIGAGVGVIVQAMIDHGAGNPVICIDEIEKAAKGYSRASDFQNELLSVLDESSTDWFDNFLEMKVDASHIPFIFTANEKEELPSPLLDRMEVIRMENPSLEMLLNIMKLFTLPRTLEEYSCDRIEFEEQELETLVEMLWDNGNKSCRAYQKAVELLVSNAYLHVIEDGHPVKVTEKDIEDAVEICLNNRRVKAIGFSM